jgi:uncharacterized membrane protein
MTAILAARRGWLLPAGLVLLSFVPVAAGLSRLTQLATGGPITPGNERFFDSPVPVVVHVAGVLGYALLGALQFWPQLRARHPRYHRYAGRLVVPCGFAVALSGLWMTLFYAEPPTDNALLEVFRVIAASAMATCLVLGVVAVRRRDFVRHRAWMVRAYAIALGAGTQVFTHLPWVLLVGTPGGYPRDAMMATGWLINVAVAEWFLRRRPSRRRDAAPEAA